jgi:general secretion pathway protein F
MMQETASRMFRYDAIAADGRRDRGTLAAPNAQRALRILKDRGLLPLDVSPSSSWSVRTMSDREAAAGLQSLAELVATGMPVSRAVAVFGAVAPSAWQARLPLVTESLRSGTKLSAALAALPKPLPAGSIAVISAGEHGDGLASGLARAAELLEDSAAARAELFNALAYPALLAIAGAGSVLMLVTVILPKFSAILADLGQSLPPATRALMSVAQVVEIAGPTLLVVMTATAAVGWWWIQTSDGAAAWQELLLGLPVVGTIRRNTAVARTCASAAALIASGVRLPEAWRLAADAAGDRAMQKRLLSARRSIVAGSTIWRACADSDALTPTAVQLVRVGEESGQLAAMLDRSARIHRGEALRKTRLLIRFLEPALIIGFAAIIGGVAAALFQAMYAIRPAS